MIENNDCYYRVRIQAAHVLADVWTKMASSWNGPLPLVAFYKKCFMFATSSNSSSSSNAMVKSNDFVDLQAYFLQTSLPLAMASVRNAHNACHSDVVRFLLDLVKFNENSKNKFSDCCLRASLVDALSATLSPSVSVAVAVALESDTASAAASSSQARLVIEQIVLKLNMEKIVPSYRYTVTCSCLRALRHLQKLGHTPDDCALFKAYASYENNFEEVRMVAFDILVEILSSEWPTTKICFN